MADSITDTRIRAEIAKYLGPSITEALKRFEGAKSQEEFDMASSDVKQFKEWLDWLKTAQTGDTRA